MKQLLLLLFALPWCIVSAVQAENNSAHAGELARQIAVGRLQTQLEQELRLLESMRSMTAVLEELVPHADAMMGILANLPNTERLQQALGRMQQQVQPPPLSPAAPSSPPSSSKQDIQLALLQPPEGERPGKAIFRIGDNYEIRYQDEELELHGRRYRLQEVSTDAVQLVPLDGGPTRRVQWQ